MICEHYIDNTLNIEHIQYIMEGIVVMDGIISNSGGNYLKVTYS